MRNIFKVLKGTSSANHEAEKIKLEAFRRKAQEAENKTLDIVNNLSDGLLIFDKKDILSLINPRAKEFLNVEDEEVIGKHISKISNFGHLKELVPVLNREKEVFRKELALSKNLILEVSSVFILRARQRKGFMVILHNVTREKMIEKMKTEFVSISAHQLRTPLSAIKWTLRMFLDGDLGPVSDKQKEFLHKTYKSNERMISLINDLLNTTRIEEGRYVFKTFPFDLEKICQSVIASFQPRMKAKNLELVFVKPEGRIPKIKLDNEKITLVIQNLLENALRYTPSGGKVTVSLENVKMKAKLCVKDTGIGIPLDQVHRVFSKFFRATNVVKIDTEGTGLGLYIAKNVIEAHKGRIWFETEQDKGSIFCFELPL